MATQEKNFSRKKTSALNNYAQERRKTSNELNITIQKILCQEKLIAGLISGIFFGVIFGGINLGAKALKTKILDQKEPPKTILQQRIVRKNLTFSTMMIVTIFVLISLLLSYNACREISSQDVQDLAKKLAKGYFKQTFENGHYTKEMAGNAKYIAALIVNDMPKETLEYLRLLAIAGLSYDGNGYFEINNLAIDVAQGIISEHIDAHPEIQDAIAQIMDNEKKQTYVLNRIQQKTK